MALEEPLPSFMLDQGLATAEREVLGAQTEEGGRIEVVAVADSVCCEGVQQFVFDDFDEKARSEGCRYAASCRSLFRIWESGSEECKHFLLERRQILQVNSVQFAVIFEMLDGFPPDHVKSGHELVFVCTLLSKLAFS